MKPTMKDEAVEAALPDRGKMVKPKLGAPSGGYVNLDAAEKLEVVAWGMPDQATVYMDGSQPWIARSREFRGAEPLVRQSDAQAIIEEQARTIEKLRAENGGLRDVIAELEDVVSDMEAERQVIIAAERAAEARLAEAVEVMEPFADVKLIDLTPDAPDGMWVSVPIGWCRRARTFLQSLGKEASDDKS